jgi:hypothetical protein
MRKVELRPGVPVLRNDQLGLSFMLVRENEAAETLRIVRAVA